ncbi:MAG: 2-hydroxyacyl-CoA dehydratase family protein [Chloroflexota bacterium]
MSSREQHAEERLKRLLDAASEQNRNRWALQWKERGKKVVGVFDQYVPREIICAAGMLPWRVIGTQQASTPLAERYRPLNTCLYCNHVLESLLAGQLDFLEGAVFTDWDDDQRRLYDAFAYCGRLPFNRMVHLPHQDSELAYQHYMKGLAGLARELEQLSGVSVTDDALRKAIEVCNKTRRLLKRVYALRKKKVPPLSGAEVLALTTAAFVMPNHEFNQELEALLPYLKTRRTSLKPVKPRLLVASDRLDNPTYLQLIEDVGCLVAMDDIDTGSRYFWQMVETESGSSPLYALSKSYITQPACPRMFFWERQVEQVIAWVKEYRCDGVLNFPQMYSFNRLFAAPYFKERLTEVGIPVATLLREYHLSGEGQLRTRIGAFLEMLQ